MLEFLGSVLLLLVILAFACSIAAFLAIFVFGWNPFGWMLSLLVGGLQDGLSQKTRRRSRAARSSILDDDGPSFSSSRSGGFFGDSDGGDGGGD